MHQILRKAEDKKFAQDAEGGLKWGMPTCVCLCVGLGAFGKFS